MRENVRNVKSSRAGRERWEFALDNRQIAAVAVGALVIVGSSFVLGMNAGSMSARKAAAPVASNSLAAFDTAHDNLPTPPEPKNWEYEKLGGGRASDAATTAAAQARVPPSPRPLTPRPADSPVAVASATPPASSDPVASAAVPAAGAPPATSDAAAKPAASEPVKPAAVAPPSPAVAKASPPIIKPPAPAPAAAAPSAMEKAMAAVSGSSRASAAAPKSAPGAYVIQIGASTNRSEADRIASRFASRGARVVTADVEGKRWYRVRLASKTYGDRPEAERALTRLARETGVRGFVTAAQ